MSEHLSRLAVLPLILLSENAFATTAPPAISAPALDTWGLLGLSVLAGLVGIIALRRKRK